MSIPQQATRSGHRTRTIRATWIARRFAQLGGAGAAGTAVLLLLAGPASAHVKVFSPDAAPGASATLQFRVPSEEAAATTVRVAADLPAGVSIDSVPTISGWASSTTPDSTGGSQVTWTVTDPAAAIAADDRRYFDIHTGVLPNQNSLTFAVTQTYSDGSVITWNQAVTAAGEPQYPAPVLPLVGDRPGGAPDDQPVAISSTTTSTTTSAGGTSSGGGKPARSAAVGTGVPDPTTIAARVSAGPSSPWWRGDGVLIIAAALAGVATAALIAALIVWRSTKRRRTAAQNS